MLNYFYHHLWATLLGLAVLHALDYWLTLVAAKMYRAQTSIQYDGGYELNPVLKADVSALRRISPRHLIGCAVSLLVIGGIWYGLHRSSRHLESESLADEYGRFILDFMLGMYYCLYTFIIARHLTNIAMFKRIARPGQVQGSVTFRQGVAYGASATSLFIDAGICAILLVLTLQPFFAGGVLMLLCVASQHHLLAQRSQQHSDALAAAAEAGLPPPPESGPKGLSRGFKVFLWLLIFLVCVVIFASWSRHAGNDDPDHNWDNTTEQTE